MPEQEQELAEQQEQRSSSLALRDIFKSGGKFAVADGAPDQVIIAPKFVAPEVDSEKADTILAREVTVQGYDLPVKQLDVYEHRLRVFRDLLRTEGDARSLQDAAKREKDRVGAVFRSNLAAVLAAQRPLETTYRNLAAFFQLASGPTKRPLDVQVFNLDPEKLLTDQALFDRWAKHIPRTSKLDMTNMVGMIVLPGWVGSVGALARIGEVARDAKAIVLTDLPEGDSPEAVADELEQIHGVSLANLKGSEPWKQQVAVYGNQVRFRRALEQEGEAAGPLYLWPSVLQAGMMFRGDEEFGPQVPRAGFKHPVELVTPDPLQTRWDLGDRRDHERFEKAVIPTAMAEGKVMFWGVQTLSDQGSINQVPVRRVKDLIEKTLVRFLNHESFSLATPADQRALVKAMNDYLFDNSSEDSTRLIRGGQVTRLQAISESKVAIDVSIKLKYVTETFDLRVREEKWSYTANSGDGGGWQL